MGSAFIRALLGLNNGISSKNPQKVEKKAAAGTTAKSKRDKGNINDKTK